MKIKIVKINNDSDAIFIYVPNFLKTIESELLMNELDTLTFLENYNFDSTKIVRLQKWFHKDDKYFCSSWKKRYDRWNSHKYKEFILKIENKIILFLDKLYPIINNSDLKKVTINSCLINKYRDGNDYIAPHNDTALSFGEYPTIIGLSLGDKRKILFKKIINDETKKNKKLDKKNPCVFDFTLDSNSLFIMAGSSQKYFTHEILKSDSDMHRYSLTFREHIE